MAKKNFSTEDSVAQGISRSLPSTRLDMEYSTLENPQLTVMDVDGHEQFFNGIGLAQDTTDEGMKNPNSIPIGGNIRSCFSDTDITPPPR